MSEDASKENQPSFVPPVSSFTGPVGELIAQRMLTPPPRPGVLAVVDHYEVLRLLGGGGMGVVLLGRDLANGREVAIKLVKSELVTNQHAVHRFLKETGHLKRLQHTNIVPVEEISDRAEGPYFVMPYFEKGSLAGRIKPGRPLDTESILDVAIQVAEGLSFAHRSGIIHRDLKPANILLGADGRACLADFGLARTVFNDTIVDVESRQLEGTAPYVSPAIAAGDAEDTRCDIYSFGALLYEMLTGLPPYQGRGTKEILDQILAGPPKSILSLNPAADRGLVAVAEGCMARELRDRYADMRDVLKDLRRIQAGEQPVGKREIGAARKGQKALLAILWLTGIALLASAAWMYLREKSQTEIVAQPTNSAVSNATVSSNKIVAPSNEASTVVVPTNALTPVISQIESNKPPVLTNAPIVSAPTNVVVSQPEPVQVVTNSQTAEVTNTPTSPPPLAIKIIPPLAAGQPIVNEIAQLAVHGLDETVISNYAKENPPKSPLTVAEANYLRTNGVSENVIDILREAKPTVAVVAVTNQPPLAPRSNEVPAMLKTAYEKYNLHQDQEAIDYCDRVLRVDPQNPNAWCIKAIAEDAVHNSAEAIKGYSTFLKLAASKAPQFANWRAYATNRLRVLRGW